jgi:hypothetical protein
MTDIPLSERLKYGLDDGNTEILPIEFLQKYVAYAHKYVHPRYIRSPFFLKKNICIITIE